MLVKFPWVVCTKIWLLVRLQKIEGSSALDHSMFDWTGQIQTCPIHLRSGWRTLLLFDGPFATSPWQASWQVKLLGESVTIHPHGGTSPLRASPEICLWPRVGLPGTGSVPHCLRVHVSPHKTTRGRSFFKCHGCHAPKDQRKNRNTIWFNGCFMLFLVPVKDGRWHSLSPNWQEKYHVYTTNNHWLIDPGWGDLDLSKDRGEMAPLVWLVAGNHRSWCMKS